MILFPATGVFADLGAMGVSMFFVTAVVAQLVYTFGGSGFAGANGSMMIEVVVRTLFCYERHAFLGARTLGFTSRFSTSLPLASLRKSARRSRSRSSPLRWWRMRSVLFLLVSRSFSSEL